MKIVRLERLRDLQRQYHKTHPWRLSAGGLYIPHNYADISADRLSWWDDVGFVLNGRRIIVWWQHPRDAYAHAIQENSRQIVGECPENHKITQGTSKNYRLLGKCRKKLVSYTFRTPSEDQKRHYGLLRQAHGRLSKEGIDLDIPPSWKWQRLNWAMGVSLVAPLEVRNETELASVAHLARRLILGQSNLDEEFPGYCYGRSNWLCDAEKMK